MKQEKPRYVYFSTNKENNGEGIAYLGYTFDVETKTLKFALGFCSPKDRFSRKIAHTVVNGRISKGKCMEISVPTWSYRRRLNEVLPVIIEVMKRKDFRPEVFGMTDFPGWAVSEKSDNVFAKLLNFEEEADVPEKVEVTA